jgi:hypothetical protein
MPSSGIPAVSYLSPAGQQTLGIWVGNRSSFSAVMSFYDAVGAWIYSPWHTGELEEFNEPITLLKWDYVATMTFETPPEQPPARASIGFYPLREA